jgi:hypothetical protein
MAKTGITRYTTITEIRLIIQACRRQTDKISLDYADTLEAFARQKFGEDAVRGLMDRPVIRNAPECHIHNLPMVFDPRLEAFVCPDPFCRWTTREDDEPHGEGAQVFHMIEHETAANASHGSAKHGKKHEKPPKKRGQDEPSPNALRIRLGR